MRNPKRELEDFQRFEQILKILTNEGFGFILDELEMQKHVPLATRIMNNKRETRPERLRETLEQLGTTFIKLGQILAERPDMIPEEYAEELQNLQDSAPSFEPSKAKEIVENEIGFDQFEEFQKEPIAAASIAQVHKAKLENGEKVIVKIRRPGIKEQVKKDLEIINYIAKEGEKHSSSFQKMDVLKFVNEFSKWTEQELNMEKECMNAQVFKENMENVEKVKIPEVYPELTTEKVLVMEYVEGIKCTETEKLKQLDINEKKIAKTAIKTGLRQSMLDGFFHADPHPSNFLISKEGDIIYLDFGMMGKIGKEKSEKLGLMLLYMIREDVKSMMDCLEEIGSKTEKYDREEARKLVEEKVLILKNSTLKQHSITKQMFDLFVELANEGLHMPSNLALMGKSLVTMEGIGLTIYPDFKITGEYERMVEKTLKEKNSPEEMSKDLAIDIIKNKDLITKLPTKLNRKLESENETGTRIEKHPTNIYLMPAALIISSGILIAGSIFSRFFLYLGLIELGYGIYLQRNN